MRDRSGLVFFTFAAVVSTLAAREQPSLLAWLAALHNMILALIYSRRKPAKKDDRLGLCLGMLGALVPLLAPYPITMQLPWIILGLLGYVSILWSLITLRNCFGVAPADRGLIDSGPYRLVRHPMYLGELVLRAALIASSPKPLIGLPMLVVFTAIQILRARREEGIISGYANYASQVRYRLLPGVW